MTTETSTANKPATDFKRRFLLLILVSGALFTGLFEIGALVGATPLTAAHFRANAAYIVASTLLAGLLARFPDRFEAIARAHAVDSFLIFLSALYNMPADEMRFLWFYLQAGGTFLLLGTGLGWATIVLSCVVVVGSRAIGAIELSDNGLGTFCLGLACAGAMFHAYNRQAARHAADLEAAYAIIDHRANHDGLTGLLNLPAFRAAAEGLARIATRNRTCLSVLFIDVDRFKSINDRFGHAGGDAVLVAVAAAIRAAVRTSDVVARIGGEEIVVLMPDTDDAGAATVAEKVRASVEATVPTVGDQSIVVTISIGFATATAGQPTLDALVRAADEAMFRAKQGGRNRVEKADLPADGRRVA